MRTPGTGISSGTTSAPTTWHAGVAAASIAATVVPNAALSFCNDATDGCTKPRSTPETSDGDTRAAEARARRVMFLWVRSSRSRSPRPAPVVGVVADGLAALRAGLACRRRAIACTASPSTSRRRCTSRARATSLASYRRQPAELRDTRTSPCRSHARSVDGLMPTIRAASPTEKSVGTGVLTALSNTACGAT